MIARKVILDLKCKSRLGDLLGSALVIARRGVDPTGKRKRGGCPPLFLSLEKVTAAWRSPASGEADYDEPCAACAICVALTIKPKLNRSASPTT